MTINKVRKAREGSTQRRGRRITIYSIRKERGTTNYCACVLLCTYLKQENEVRI